MSGEEQETKSEGRGEEGKRLPLATHGHAGARWRPVSLLMTVIFLGLVALPCSGRPSRAAASAAESLTRVATPDDSTDTEARFGLHLWLRVASHSGPMVIVMADLAHLREMDKAFEQIKATHGPVVAEHVVHETARRMRAFTGPSPRSRRDDDGGFLFILPSCNKAAVRDAARRIRAAVDHRARRPPDAELIAFSLGIGVVSGDDWVSQGPVAFEQAVAGAQAQANLSGRHCVELPVDGPGSGAIRAQGTEPRRLTIEPGHANRSVDNQKLWRRSGIPKTCAGPTSMRDLT
ncbi:MAG: diguanylate cyclase domain-containing protein [Nitrospiraceae bacterium]